MIINHNISALNTHRQLGANNNNVQNSLEKLSSGLQINKAGDDAAGLAISEKMRGQIRGLDMASKNAEDGISLIQTAEGALNESHEILQRMRELAVQSSNDTNTDADRQELQNEVDALAKELTRISDNTEFNTQNLLDGDFEATFHIGANAEQNLSIEINNMGAEKLGVMGKELSPSDVGDFAVTNTNGEEIDIEIVDPSATDEAFSSNFDADNNKLTISLATNDENSGDITSTHEDVLDAINAVDGLSAEYTGSDDIGDPTDAVSSATVSVSEDTGVVDPDKGINISSQDAADSAITTIQDAIDTVSSQRSELGAIQNRLEHTINNLGASSENLTAAESRIRDVDHTEAA